MKVDLFIKDGLGTKVAHDVDLLRAPYRRQHASATRARKLDEQLPHPASASVKQARMIRTQRKQRVRKIMRRATLQHQRRGDLERDGAGDLDQPPGGYHRILGVAAAA